MQETSQTARRRTWFPAGFQAHRRSATFAATFRPTLPYSHHAYCNIQNDCIAVASARNVGRENEAASAGGEMGVKCTMNVLNNSRAQAHDTKRKFRSTCLAHHVLTRNYNDAIDVFILLAICVIFNVTVLACQFCD